MSILSGECAMSPLSSCLCSFRMKSWMTRSYLRSGDLVYKCLVRAAEFIVPRSILTEHNYFILSGLQEELGRFSFEWMDLGYDFTNKPTSGSVLSNGNYHAIH